MNDRAQKPRCEKPRSERTGSVLPDGRELPQSGFDRRGHVTKLPPDLLTDCVWSIGGGQTSCLGGIRGRAQGVRAHMRDGCSLSGRSGGRCCSSADLTSHAPIPETATDLFRDAKLAVSEGPRPGDRLSGTGIPRGFRLEQSQHPLRAVRRPPGDDAPVRFAQCLRRTHTQILPRVSALGPSMAIRHALTGPDRHGPRLRLVGRPVRAALTENRSLPRDSRRTPPSATVHETPAAARARRWRPTSTRSPLPVWGTRARAD